MKYLVCAYLCTNLVGMTDVLPTDNYEEAMEFIRHNCQKGYNCTFIDNETGITGITYADDFNIDYADLLMEQQEQM